MKVTPSKLPQTPSKLPPLKGKLPDTDAPEAAGASVAEAEAVRRPTIEVEPDSNAVPQDKVPPDSAEEGKWNLPLAGFLCGFLDGTATFGLLVTLLPFFVTKDCDADLGWVGIILGTWNAGVCVGNVFWGRLCDRWKLGATNVLPLACCCHVVGQLLTAFSPSVVVLAVTRFFTGCCCMQSCAMSYVLNTTPPTRAPQLLAWYTAAMLTGFMTSSLYAAPMYNSIGFQNTMLYGAGLSATCAGVVYDLTRNNPVSAIATAPHIRFGIGTPWMPCTTGTMNVVIWIRKAP